VVQMVRERVNDKHRHQDAMMALLRIHRAVPDEGLLVTLDAAGPADDIVLKG